MAVPRAYWKGQLRLSLVAVPVTLYSATESASSLSLHQIHKPSGQRIRYEKVVPGIGPVDADEIVKGFALDKESHVVLEPEELDEIRLESRDRIDLVQFVGHSEIDPRYYEKPYYVAPQNDAAAEGYVVIRDALRAAGKVGLGQMAMRGKEYLVALKPCGRGLLLETLRYADEVRASDAVFSDIPDLEVEDEMIELAHELIERKSAPFDPAAFHDSYADALRDLIERKRRGKAVIDTGPEEHRQSGQVIDLMEALRNSVRGGRSGAKSGSRGGSGTKAPGKAPAREKTAGEKTAGEKASREKTPARTKKAAGGGQRRKAG